MADNRITAYDLLNVRIDLSDVLSWRAAQKPAFIRLFNSPNLGMGQSKVAYATEHQWLEGASTPKTKTFTAVSNGTFTVASSTGWEIGDLCHILGDSASLRITNVSTTTITVEVVAANGSSIALSTYAPAAGGTLIFDSRPIAEGSTLGESMQKFSGVASNYTQIFRADVALTGTAVAVGQYGRENDLTVQVQYATDEIIRRMNEALIYGPRTSTAPGRPAAMGGLYYFGTQEGCNKVEITDSARLTVNHINEAARNITEAGCIPNAIICGIGQALVISSLMSSQVRFGRQENVIGNYVDTVVTSAGGNSLRVLPDPMIPDTDLWVCDTRGFALLPLNGRALHTEPSTIPGQDGRSAMIIGEYTAEFKNAQQALCRISGLKPSAEALKE